jgi:deoxyribodipyrimidine photolyase
MEYTAYAYYQDDYFDKITVSMDKKVHIQAIEDELVLEDDDESVFYPVELTHKNGTQYQAFTMYKRVDKKIRPVSTTFSPEYQIRRTIPEDPLKSLPALTPHPPPFQPTK